VAGGEDNLEGVFSGLQSTTSAIEHEMQAARDEIKQANDDIAAAERNVQQTQSEIGAVSGQIAHLPEAQQQQRTQLQAKLSSLEQQLPEANQRLAARRQELQVVLGKQREEAARKRLEQERGRALVHAQGLFHAIRDGAVAWLFAKRALIAFAQLGVKPEAFQSVTDQQTVANILAEFSNAEKNVNMYDRREAERFEAIERLSGEIAGLRDGYAGQRREAMSKRSTLLEEQNRLKAQITGLERPETSAETKARHIRSIAGFAFGAVAIAVGAVLAASGPDTAPWGITAIVLGLVGLVVGWLNTDTRRTRRLADLRQALRSSEEQLQALDAGAAQSAETARQQAENVRHRLGELGSDRNTAVSASGDDPFADSAGNVLALRNTWLAAHPDIRFVGDQHLATAKP
jgi:chromosome segregation ATPase